MKRSWKQISRFCLALAAVPYAFIPVNQPQMIAAFLPKAEVHEGPRYACYPAPTTTIATIVNVTTQ